MQTYFHTFVGLLITCLLFVLGGIEKEESVLLLPEKTDDQLIVFTDVRGGYASEDFRANYLPELKTIANQMGIQVVERDISEGAPKELHLTPAIVFQNSKGRSIYVGRYSELGRVKNFIRTARQVPQEIALNEKDDMLVMRRGRLQLIAPLKVTELTGVIPDGFDQEVFLSEMRDAVNRGMKQFDVEQKVRFERSDRAFYMAYYPYLSKKGNLYVSCALYSQFNCVKPVFEQVEKPISGSWEDRASVFESAAALLEKKIEEQLKGSVSGDALEVIEEDVKLVSWEKLGLALPEGQENDMIGMVGEFVFANDWKVEGAIDAFTPMIQFNYPAPLDGYSGEVTAFSGNMELEGKVIGKGLFEVETESVTMGDAGLDEKVHYKYIKTKAFPRSSFRFDAVTLAEDLRIGEAIQAEVMGTFVMMGKEAPVKVMASFEPILIENGALRLAVSTSFRLNLKGDFGIDGPDGPKEASNFMDFYMNFLMAPSEG